MAEKHTVDDVDLTCLACHAEALSTGLNALRSKCGHQATSSEIFEAAEELMLLSSELMGLDMAIKTNKDQYTEAFEEDLKEIYHHLQGIFEDIEDCCREMQKADRIGATSVGWLHRKPHVKRLRRHLEANKSTLIVMRTVLHHGTEYGSQSSSERLAEPSPHILQEDLAILQSVFASKAAITELQDSAKKSHQHSSSSASSATTPTFKPGAHGRNLSTATGVETLVVEDVIPSSKAAEKKEDEDPLERRFSRRGVRLAVHSSILDLNAHEVPDSLKKRWIYKAKFGGGYDHARIGSPSIAQLSKISEVSSSLSPEKPDEIADSHRRGSAPEYDGKQSDQFSIEEPSNTHVSKAKKRSSTLMASPVGKTLGKVITKLSTTNLHRGHNEDHEQVETKPNHEKDEKSGWTYRLTKRFEKSALTTPDFNKDDENMALR
ncbi:hypothetical protein LTR20_008114 [Exophiala xenobiotica]|nr:hypothetical protein LTR93_004987 [Exophiala xenobiotica]KAK5384058.1 hypothetical protein LTS13_002251 [Exophiala xenobiotica]KAK5399623.1 hypothetical protein LTR79_003260 [Exophiala xenobiotica]KAK5411001.1 hypothetical protein LTR06_005891 [Exophiala xenobiotica]KAK5416291.1 hypothetical protein LTR90_005512 [Exophiala xenobiotica]